MFYNIFREYSGLHLFPCSMPHAKEFFPRGYDNSPFLALMVIEHLFFNQNNY